METYTGNTELMRELNKSMILNIIRKDGPISRVEIAKRLKLSASTVTNVTKALLEEQELIEIGEGESTGGRRPILLQYNFRSGYVAGVYLGEMTVRIALADLQGRILRQVDFPTKQALQLKGLINTVVYEIYECLAAENLSADALRSLGVAVSGITDIETGTVIYSKYIENWRDFPLAEVLHAKLGVPVRVDNEMFMAALGELWLGEGKDITNMVSVAVGVGIGVAIVIDKKVYRGSRYSAGELGDVIISNGDLKGIQRSGYLERRAGWQAVEKLGRNIAAEHRDSIVARLAGSDSDKVTPQIVFEAARLHDKYATSVIEEVSLVLGTAIANLISLLDPDIVLLTGEITSVSDIFMDPICRQVQELIPHSPPIRFSTLGQSAEVLGAIRVALDSITTNLNVSELSSL